MKIIILGSEGFIGSYLVKTGIEKGYQITGCDLVDKGMGNYNYYKTSLLSSDIDSLFNKEPYDICINASGIGNVPYSIDNPLNDFDANTRGVFKALDSIRKYNTGCRYVQISSAAVYGNPKSLPVKETDTIAPLSPYGYHKWMSEIICKEYHNLYNVPLIIIRPFSVYGNGLRKQLLWDICSKLKNADAIELNGTGNESRDFIHVSDLAGLIYSVIAAGIFDGRVLNAASGVETTINEIAGFFSDYHSGAKKIKFSGRIRIGDPLNWRGDIVEANAIGFSAGVTLQDGIAEYIRWFQAL